MFKRINITTGAPNIAVTVLMLSSVGANKFRAKRSQKRQKRLPPKKLAGIKRIGLLDLKSFLIKCGAAIPTNEIGPAKATMHAERRLDKSTINVRKAFTFTPMPLAKDSPKLYASRGFDKS